MSVYYSDDKVTLYHGDCLEHPEWWTGADVLVTDPPYGIAWIAKKFGSNTEARREASRFRAAGNVTISGDTNTEKRDCALTQWGNRPALVFGSWRMPRPPAVQHRLIWYKEKTYAGVRPGPWFPADEEIYVLGTGFAGPPSQNVYVTSRMLAGSHGLVAEVGHPTPKPLDLMERLISKCPPGVIADPFAGSGSTLVAAKALGRTAVGVELEERYCEIAARRLSQDVFDFGSIA